MPIITLPSDGEPCEVKTLGLFDLDALAPNDAGRYTYEMKLASGETAVIEFPLERYDEPPPKPEKPESEILEGTTGWYRLLEWQRYQAALSHEIRRADQVVGYVEDVAAFILEHCLSDSDKGRIVDQGDWEEVYSVALVPQLTIDLITRTLQQTFRAKFDDEEIFDALNKASGGKGAYDGLRLWENELMISMSMSEMEYSMLPLLERARKVCAQQLPKWLSFLEMDDHRKATAVAAAQAKAAAG